jgi:hypothetical protein
MRGVFGFLVAVLAIGPNAMAPAVAAQVGPPRPGPRCLAGEYDGGQTEMAARLELRADHRFSYMLSYGALDEVAEGTWENDAAAAGIVLTSDATIPPRFTLEGQASGPPGRLQLALDVPTGVSRQYFNAIVRFADGRIIQRQFAEEGLELEFAPGDRPVGITLLLPVFDVQSENFALDPDTAAEVRFRFAPNDLGKVAFARTPLRFDKQDLLFERHERQIRFRRTGDCERPGR